MTKERIMNFLPKTDPQVYKILKSEQKRQAETLMMIPSENHTSAAVREAVGSCFQDKYCEGYPFKRYYQGQVNFDKLETLAQERVKKAFGVPYVNLQPLSGAPANSAVYFGLLEPGDKIMGLSLSEGGGHITHGLPINFSGRYFKNVPYRVSKKTGFIDYEEMEKIALRERPKIIIAGITSYPRIMDFKKFARVADKVGAYLMADVAHIAGLILAGVYPNPVPYCHIVNTTTHKTLRGARGALIMITKKGIAKDPELVKKIDRAVFPGLQGGPHMNNIAGIMVAFKEASKPAFKKYGQQIVKNARVLAEYLIKEGFKLCSGGTDTHLILLDMRSFNISGKLAAEALEAAGMVANYNVIPYDPNPPFFPCGVRLGTPGMTSRGMKEKQMKLVANWMGRVIKDIAKIKKEMKIKPEEERKRTVRQKIIARPKEIKKIRLAVKQLCQKFSIRRQY
jgi:glycine hydroxymethyltransferase